MKRLGTITIATLGLGLALSGFSSTASAASSTCPLKAGMPQQAQNFQQFQQSQWYPYLTQFAQQFGNQQQVQHQQMPYQYQYQIPQQQQSVNKQTPAAAAPQQSANKQTPAAATPKQPANNATAPAKQSNQQAATSAFAKQVADLVNQERAKAGLKAVEMDASLSNVALAKATDMSNNNYFSHTSPTYGSPFDMMNKFGISYSTAGENIAMGQRSPEEVMNQWMNSEGHRQNIMNPSFTKIGVGYVNGYWVQEFIG